MENKPRYRLYLALGLVTFTTASHAAVFDSDDRIVAVTEQHSPYSPIGVVSPLSGLGSWFFARYTTGFLVNNCHAMTVQHLLGGTESPVGKRVRFTAGFTALTKETTHGTVVLAGGLENSQGEAAYESARARDWMLIRLDRCIGRTLGYVALQPALPSTPVKSAGFPSNLFREPLKVDPNCRIRFRTQALALNDCASLTGNSGSPIFQELKVGSRTTLVVYAMQTAGWNKGGKTTPFEWRYANVATPVSHMWRHVAAAVARDLRVQTAAR